MSKAILILDMPDRCGHCRLSAMVKYYAMCMVTGLECTENGRPEWCPLREPPGKIEVEIEHYDTSMDYYDWGFVNGWNECRDQLIDEEDDDEQSETVG